MDTTTAAVALRANEARRAQGVAILPLSKAVGVSPSTLNRLFSGKSEYNVSTLIRVAKALNADAGTWINEASTPRDNAAEVAA